MRDFGAAGRFNAQLMDFRDHGTCINTLQLDKLAHDYTVDHGHTPALGDILAIQKTICTSVNEVVCHGIPNTRPLKDGDIINVDITTIVNGWYGDQSETFMIGEVSASARRLIQTTFDALFVGINASRRGGTVTEIGRAIQSFATKPDILSFALIRGMASVVISIRSPACHTIRFWLQTEIC